MSRHRTLLHAPALLACLVLAAPARAQETVPARAGVAPEVLRLGERAVYRAHVIVPPKTAVKWLTPEANEALTWGERSARRTPRYYGGGTHPVEEDTVAIEIPVQAFQLGRITIPGLGVQIGTGERLQVHYVPTTTLVVMPVIAATDSQSTLRDVHGPLAAPWWERVPWLLVLAAVLALVAIILLVRWLRRRRPAPVRVAPTVVVSPAQQALAALQELRARRLPQHERFAEHAFHLGQILRRYLEATLGTPLPGDTTRELVARLESGGLGSEDVRRLALLMRGWDQIKFAREPATAEEALRTETAVESFVRRATGAAVPQREVA